MRTKFRLKILNRREKSEDLGIDGKIILKWSIKKYICKDCIEITWLKAGTGGEIL
jgi:hypothetical protein